MVEKIQGEPDGLYQCTIPIIKLSGPHGHKKNMFDGASTLPMPETTNTVENKKIIFAKMYINVHHLV